MTKYLCGAAWTGNLTEVLELLPQLNAVGLNGYSERGQTALYCAARQGHTPILLELLNQEAIDLEKAPQEHGGSPLHAAGFAGHEEAVALLLYRGANPSAVNNRGVTARAEARGAALGPYHLYESEGKDSLLKHYPSCKLVKLPAKKDDGPLKEKTSGPSRIKTTSRRAAVKKANIPRLVPHTWKTTYIQNQEPEIIPLSKPFAMLERVLVLLGPSYNAPFRKFLDNIVLVNSLLHKLGTTVVLIGGSTWEASGPFFKEYAMLGANLYQDPSFVSYDVFGCKKSEQTALMLVKNPQGHEIIWESWGDHISVPEILIAAGASVEQAEAFGYLDSPMAERSHKEKDKDHKDKDHKDKDHKDKDMLTTGHSNERVAKKASKIKTIVKSPRGDPDKNRNVTVRDEEEAHGTKPMKMVSATNIVAEKKKKMMEPENSPRRKNVINQSSRRLGASCDETSPDPPSTPKIHISENNGDS